MNARISPKVRQLVGRRFRKAELRGFKLYPWGPYNEHTRVALELSARGGFFTPKLLAEQDAAKAVRQAMRDSLDIRVGEIVNGTDIIVHQRPSRAVLEEFDREIRASSPQ